MENAVINISKQQRLCICFVIYCFALPLEVQEPFILIEESEYLDVLKSLAANIMY